MAIKIYSTRILIINKIIIKREFYAKSIKKIRIKTNL
jgi:hypothetical protein